MVNINIEIAGDLHRRLKLNAITRQQTIKQYLLDCLADTLDRDALLARQEHAAHAPATRQAPARKGGAR